MGIITPDTMLIVGMVLALGAGAMSFLSPCVLPIFPAYLSYITGISVKELQENQDGKIRKKLLSHAIFFLLGVSLIFISLGIGASLVGEWIRLVLTGESGLFIQRIAGVFIIIMGLFVGGWLNLKFLMREKRFQPSKRPTGFLGTFFVGMGFAAGWTPCIGPIFGSILFLAASEPTYGVIYTLMYVIGFSLPFLILTFFLSKARWIVRHSQIIMRIGAVVMIIMGLVLFTGQMPKISAYLLRLIEGTWLTNLG